MTVLDRVMAMIDPLLRGTSARVIHELLGLRPR